ncbi:uncharacterized protein [Amphiura filiformis]|uniref:uncharacterized protein n=1 Tax=Amphiura filiformis TaxID=82378 RepID=UPI003B20D513
MCAYQESRRPIVMYEDDDPNPPAPRRLLDPIDDPYQRDYRDPYPDDYRPPPRRDYPPYDEEQREKEYYREEEEYDRYPAPPREPGPPDDYRDSRYEQPRSPAEYDRYPPPLLGHDHERYEEPRQEADYGREEAYYDNGAPRRRPPPPDRFGGQNRYKLDRRYPPESQYSADRGTEEIQYRDTESRVGGFRDDEQIGPNSKGYLLDDPAQSHKHFEQKDFSRPEPKPLMGTTGDGLLRTPLRKDTKKPPSLLDLPDMRPKNLKLASESDLIDVRDEREYHQKRYPSSEVRWDAPNERFTSDRRMDVGLDGPPHKKRALEYAPAHSELKDVGRRDESLLASRPDNTAYMYKLEEAEKDKWSNLSMTKQQPKPQPQPLLAAPQQQQRQQPLLAAPQQQQRQQPLLAAPQQQQRQQALLATPQQQQQQPLLATPQPQQLQHQQKQDYHQSTPATSSAPQRNQSVASILEKVATAAKKAQSSRIGGMVGQQLASSVIKSITNAPWNANSAELGMSVGIVTSVATSTPLAAPTVTTPAQVPPPLMATLVRMPVAAPVHVPAPVPAPVQAPAPVPAPSATHVTPLFASYHSATSSSQTPVLPLMGQTQRPVLLGQQNVALINPASSSYSIYAMQSSIPTPISAPSAPQPVPPPLPLSVPPPVPPPPSILAVASVAPVPLIAPPVSVPPALTCKATATSSNLTISYPTAYSRIPTESDTASGFALSSTTMAAASKSKHLNDAPKGMDGKTDAEEYLQGGQTSRGFEA